MKTQITILLVLALTTIAASQAFAVDFCFINNKNQQRCEQQPQCFYTPGRSRGICYPTPNASEDQARFCFINNNNPGQCNNQPTCYHVTVTVPGQCNPY